MRGNSTILFYEDEITFKPTPNLELVMCLKKRAIPS